MSLQDEPNRGLLTMITVMAVSCVSGFISIAQRIARGRKANLLWVVSEFLAAILCGYLAYDAYPHLSLPSWLTMPVMVAVVAHTGGRAFQEIEEYLHKRYLRSHPEEEHVPPPNHPPNP